MARTEARMVIPGLRGMSLRAFLRELYEETNENDLFDVASQLAYNALLAVFPFLIFLVTIVGFLPLHGLDVEIRGALDRFLAADAAQTLDASIQGVVHTRNPALLAVSLAGSIWAASGGVSSFTSALNRAYETRETRSWLRVRAQSLGLTLLATVLIVIGSAALVIGPGVVARVAHLFHLGHTIVRLWALLRWPATIAAMSLMLALLYWACPDVHQRFKFVTPGSVFAVLLWVGVTLLFNLYVNRLGAGSFNRTYGTLAGGVVLMVWFYLSGLIALIGGEINAIIERHSPEGKAARERHERWHRK